jgi:hypothetical protein
VKDLGAGFWRPTVCHISLWCVDIFSLSLTMLTFVATQMQFRMKSLNWKEISVLTAVYIFSQNGSHMHHPLTPEVHRNGSVHRFISITLRL